MSESLKSSVNKCCILILIMENSFMFIIPTKTDVNGFTLSKKPRTEVSIIYRNILYE